MGTVSHVLEVEDATFTVAGKSLAITMNQEEFEFSESSVAELVDFLRDYLLEDVGA